MAFNACPNCNQQKWASQTSYPNNVRQQMLHCMECGFEVDLRVVRDSRRILRRDGGQDVHAEEPEHAQGAGE